MKTELWETAILFGAIASFWPKILGKDHLVWDIAIIVFVPLLVWVAVRRWRRFSEEVERQQAEQDKRRGPPTL